MVSTEEVRDNNMPPIASEGWTQRSPLLVLDERCEDASGFSYTIKRLVRTGSCAVHPLPFCSLVDQIQRRPASSSEQHGHSSRDDSSDVPRTSISPSGERTALGHACSSDRESTNVVEHIAQQPDAVGGVMCAEAYSCDASSDEAPPAHLVPQSILISTVKGRSVDPRPSLPKDSKHALVPRVTDFVNELAHKSKTLAAPTTLMIRNIPNRYTQHEVMREIDDMGLGGTYNFFYLPIDSGTSTNIGYAFVNFVACEDAKRCMDIFRNHQFKRHNHTSRKVSTISVAHIQGFDANVAHYSKCRIRFAESKQNRPIVLPFADKSLHCQERHLPQALSELQSTRGNGPL